MLSGGKPMTGSGIRPLLVIIGVNFLWGIDFIAIEYMMHYMSPAVFTLCRLAIGAVLLLAVCFPSRGGLHIKRQDMPRVFIAGGVGMALYFSIEKLGTGLTSASFSSLIMATVPIFGMIGDRIVYGNRITPLKVICILASILGVYLLVSGEPMGISPLGLAAMFTAAILWAFYIVYTKTLFDKYDLLTLLTGLFVSGVIVQIPLTDIPKAVYRARRYEYQVQKAAADRDYLLTRLRLQERMLYQEVETAWDELCLSEKSLSLAEDTLDRLRIRYRAGEVSSADFLQTQLAVTSAKEALTDKQIAYRLAVNAYRSRLGFINE